MKLILRSVLCTAALGWALATPASAAITTYVATDTDATSAALMPNSVAMQASFLGAVANTTLIDFETGLPSGVTTNGVIDSVPDCAALCGFNTTPSGSMFLERQGFGIPLITFSFATPIDAFGVYVTGLQVTGQQSLIITYASLATASIQTPTLPGPGAGFFGFSDPGASIISVSFDRTSDIVALDDVLFHSVAPAIPEPGTWAMMLIGFAGLGLVSQRRRKLATA